MTVYPTELTAPVFDIQSFSLQDGPGIRTTVFFKGCPLRCLWCHNPESYVVRPQLMFRQNLCTGCMACTNICPSGAQQAVMVDGKRAHLLDQEKCTVCGACLEVCCYDALELLGKRFTPQGLAGAIQRDTGYYKLDTNGQRGGVTLSGGEPMLWADFIEEFLGLLPGVNIAMETSGHAKSEDYLRIAPKINLFLFDYKATDPVKHKELCGVDNTLILRNLEALYQMGCSIVLRLPLIPGVNDDDGHLRGIAQLLASHPKIRRAEIMAYHTLGIGKADGLGMHAHLAGLPAASVEQKQAWLERLHELGAEYVTLSQ